MRPAADHAAPARPVPAHPRPAFPAVPGAVAAPSARPWAAGPAPGPRAAKRARPRGAPRAPPPAAPPRARRALPARRVLRNCRRQREQSAERGGTCPAPAGRAPPGESAGTAAARARPRQSPLPFPRAQGGGATPAQAAAPHGARTALGPGACGGDGASGPRESVAAGANERYRRGKSAGAGGPCSLCPCCCPPSRDRGATDRSCCAAGGRTLKEAPCPPTR